MAKILLIDDDEPVRAVTRRMLEGKGHRVFEACNGKEGVDLFHREAFDLVVTDMIMPEQEGVETVRKLLDESPRLKIIAISGGGRARFTGFLDVARALGAKHTLEKPYTKEQLLAAVDQVLAQPADADEDDEDGESD
jgi:CheY-like chemotaxis protein